MVLVLVLLRVVLAEALLERLPGVKGWQRWCRVECCRVLAHCELLRSVSCCCIV